MRRMRRLWMLVAVALIATIPSGCDAPGQRAAESLDLPLRGTRPFAPVGKVDFALTDTRGRPFDFKRETDGRITLLFFGYTYCPDVCPIHMSTLAAALSEMEPDLRDRIQVVFVTVDPARDSAERIREWLDGFDSTFVGLRGSLDQVTAILAAYNYPPPQTQEVGDSYLVGHPASIYAYTPDNLSHVMYGSGTGKATWIHDLTLLAEHDWEGALAGDRTAPPEPEAPAPEGATRGGESAGSAAVVAATGGIEILDAFAPQPVTGEQTALYLTVTNIGSTADTLRTIESDIVSRTSLHDMVMKEGMMRMEPMQAGLVIPAGRTVRLKPGQSHGMLEGLTRTLNVGDTFRVTLVFARAGRVQVPVRVVAYQDLSHPSSERSHPNPEHPADSAVR